MTVLVIVFIAMTLLAVWLSVRPWLQPTSAAPHERRRTVVVKPVDDYIDTLKEPWLEERDQVVDTSAHDSGSCQLAAPGGHCLCAPRSSERGFLVSGGSWEVD